MNYLISELLACVVARELRNDDSIAFGLNAELMLASALLSQNLYSPGLKIRHGINYKRGFELNPAAWTSDVSTISHKLVEYYEKHDSILSLSNENSSNKLCDTFFVSGIQIDKHGNTNLIGIKDRSKKFKLRGPGCIGTTSIAQFAKKYFIFSLEHSKRRFVDKVDYISSIGYDIRKKYYISGGPLLCITPLCIFDFFKGVMRIKSIHKHSSLQQVLDKTGFKPLVPKYIPATRDPTRKELEILREIDKHGFLQETEKQIIF